MAIGTALPCCGGHTYHLDTCYNRPVQKPPRNGWLLRTFEQDGHTISEVEFIIGDPGEYPHAIGYMVGEDDGRSTLYRSVAEAITAHSELRRNERASERHD